MREWCSIQARHLCENGVPSTHLEDRIIPVLEVQLPSHTFTSRCTIVPRRILIWLFLLEKKAKKKREKNILSVCVFQSSRSPPSFVWGRGRRQTVRLFPRVLSFFLVFSLNDTCWSKKLSLKVVYCRVPWRMSYLRVMLIEEVLSLGCLLPNSLPYVLVSCLYWSWLVCVIYCHSKVFMVQATRLCNLICDLGNTWGLFLGTWECVCLCVCVFIYIYFFFLAIL
jgi:hypothetical protein